MILLFFVMPQLVLLVRMLLQLILGTLLGIMLIRTSFYSSLLVRLGNLAPSYRKE